MVGADEEVVVAGDSSAATARGLGRPTVVAMHRRPRRGAPRRCANKRCPPKVSHGPPHGRVQRKQKRPRVVPTLMMMMMILNATLNAPQISI